MMVTLAMLAASGALAQQASFTKVLLKHHKKAAASDNLSSTAADYPAAKAAFPAFCSDWGRKLKDRERINFSNIQWQEKEGWQTGYYMGYTDILTCDCKQSTHGLPIGTLTYSEVHYYLVGHTLDEAKTAKPQPIAKTDTTELFRWERDKWVY